MTEKEPAQWICVKCGGSRYLDVHDEMRIRVGCVWKCLEITEHTNLDMVLSEQIQ